MPPALRHGVAWASPRHSASSLAWVSCTPFGGPVVPEV